MRSWLQWFRGLSGRSRWKIFETILTASGLVVGVLGLTRAFRSSSGTPPNELNEAAPPPTTVTTKVEPATQQITGNDNVQIGSIKDVREVTINPKPKVVKKHVLDNDGSATLILKEIKTKENSLPDTIDPSNQWGVAAAGKRACPAGS